VVVVVVEDVVTGPAGRRRLPRTGSNLRR
jgi:hypothetical protein